MVGRGGAECDADLRELEERTVYVLQYAVDQNLAPVISISYGLCEAQFSSTDIATLTATGQQANAQGQTIVTSSGDSGPADCDFNSDPNNPVKSATHGYAVDVPASLPYVTGMGGHGIHRR